MSTWRRGAAGPAVRDPLTWVVAALVGIPIVVGGVVGFGRPDVLASDYALINLRIGDVFGSDTPLLGPFSRFDWNHPGPLMFWLLAPVWRALGSTAGAMWASAAVLNGVAAVGLVVVARRLGGRRLLMVVGVAALLLLIGLGPLVADPWNPYLVVLPFAVFVLAATAVATGDLALVPVAVGVGSFCVHSHVGYALLVGVLGLWAAGWLVGGLWRHRHQPDAPTARRLVTIGALSAAVALVLWSGPLVEQVTADPGNLSQVLGFFTGNDESTVGAADAFVILGRQLSLPGPWLGGPETVAGQPALLDPVGWWWALPTLALLGAATVVAWRRRWREPALLGATVALGVATAVVATSRINGAPFTYLLKFWWPLAMLCWVAIGWVALRLVPTETLGRHARALTGVAMAVAVALGIGAGVAASRPPAEIAGTAAVAAVADDLAAGLTPGGTYLVVPDGFSLFGELFGVVDLLESGGFTPVADARFDIHFAPGRTAGGRGAPTAFDGTIIVATSEATTALLDQPDLVALASWDPLSGRERAELEVLRAEARRALGAAGHNEVAGRVGGEPLASILIREGIEEEDSGVEATTLARLVELEGRGLPVTIFLGPPP